MYAYLKGILVEMEKDHVVLDVQGQGFFIHTPLHFYSDAPSMGKELLIHISFIVSQDSMRLFGFLKKGEKTLFEKCLTISGLGPKLALSIISHSHSLDFVKIIAEKDIDTLIKIPGIGKKTAQRILIDLCDKLDTLPNTKNEPIALDAISALISLGYKEKQATKSVQEALKGVASPPTLAELISLALVK